MTQHPTVRYPNNLRQYRRLRHLRLAEVARAIGLSSAAHLAHWERGRKLPTTDNLLKLAAVLRVPVEILYLDLLKQIRRELSSRTSPSPTLTDEQRY